MLSSYTVALFLHIVGVLLFVAGVVLAGAAFEYARRRADAGEIALILVLARAGVVLVAAGTVLLLGFGLWLVHLGRFGYDAGWVDGALALFALSLALGALGGRRPKQARILASRLATRDGPLTPELRALLDDPLSRAANYGSGLLLLAILGLMVFKP